jgi:hypothetical protein
MYLDPLILRAPILAAFELWDKDAMDAIGIVIESDERLAPNNSYPILPLIRVVCFPSHSRIILTR